MMTSPTLFDWLPVKDATFSPCERYRYTLRRQWDASKPYVLFVMLNPSTADATQNDPTIRRCIGFAKRWGYGGLLVGNIFALRSTDPRRLYLVRDPVGPDNDVALVNLHHEASFTVAAWGVHGKFNGRGDRVLQLLVGLAYPGKLGGPVYCLGITKEGYPRHPLYITSDTQPVLLERKDDPESAEKTAGLRKLLEAKDCFVRAKLEADDGG